MKITLFGYGKFGKEIAKVAEERKHNIYYVINSKNKNKIDKNKISKSDVLIDVSTPESVVNNILLAFSLKKPIVVGTTAWYDKLNYVQKECKKYNGTLLYSSNFSIGVNILFKINDILSKIMNKNIEYNVYIEETHHIHKKDSPSGTAITLANTIINNIDKKTSWINKKSNKKEELSIISIRKDEVPGIHKVKFISDIDSIELIHTAFNRKGFAYGALIAAEFIVKVNPGVYTMKDVLNLTY